MKVLPLRTMEYFSFNQKEFDYKYVVMLSDIDQFKHMSFANYLQLMFLASDALCLVFSKSQKDFFYTTHLKPVMSQMHFKQQTSFGDEILVKVHAANIHETGFDLYYKFAIEKEDLPVAHGKQSFEVTSIPSGKRILLPQSFRDFLETIQMEPTENFPDIRKPTELGAGGQALRSATVPEGVFLFDKLVVFFKHTNQLGVTHPYNFMEWTSFVREAFFQATVPNFQEVLERPIKMMTTKIASTVLSDSTFGDTFEARLTVGKIKRVSFDMIIRFYNREKKRIACETVHTVVFVDSLLSHFADIPEEMMRVILRYREPQLPA